MAQPLALVLVTESVTAMSEDFPTDTTDLAFLHFLDIMKRQADVFNGAKNQLVALGWDPINAELVIIENFKSINISNQIALKGLKSE